MAEGRSLPPLLPLEYCRIDRAARMLGCEVEDIVHWGAIGAIELAVNVKSVEGKLKFKLSDVDSLAVDRVISALTNQELDKELILYLHDTVCRVGQSLGPYAGAQYPWMGEVDELITGLIEQLDQIPATELNKNKLFEPDVSLGVTVYGMWNSNHLNLLQHKDEITIESQDLGYCEGFGHLFTQPPFRPIGTQKSYKFSFTTNQSLTVRKEDLWVTKACLSNLYESITTGKELSNIHNSVELAQRAKEQEAVTRARAPRTSHPQSEMIRALLLLHPHITEDQLAAPHKLHGVLTEMFKASSGKAVMPDVHPNTFERWLKASTNS